MTKERESATARYGEDLSAPIRISYTVRPTTYVLDGATYPVSDVAYEVQDEYPIPKLDDEWMVQVGSHEEVMDVLDGWLEGYQQHFIDPEGSAVAAEFGIKHPVRPRTARMMAFSMIDAEYAQRTAEQNDQIARLEEELAAQRVQINDQVRNKTISNGAGEKRRRKLELNHRQQAQPFIDRVKTYQSVHDLILRKFVFEQFSGVTSDDDFRLKPEDFRSVLREISETPMAEEVFTKLLMHASTYLDRTVDPYLLEKYTYKDSSKLSRNLDDTKAIALAVDLALGEENHESPLTAASQKLGESYVSFIMNQAYEKSKKQSRFTGETPILSTLYDTLNATLTIDRYPTFKQGLGILIDKTMGTVLSTVHTKTEVQRMVAKYISAASDILMHYSHILPSLPRTNPNRIPQEIKDFVISDEKRLFDGMKNGIGILFSLSRAGGPFDRTVVLKSLHEQVRAAVHARDQDLARVRSTERYLVGLNNSNEFPKLGVTVDLVNNVASYRGLQSSASEIAELLENDDLSPFERVTIERFVRESQPQKGSFAERAHEIQEAVQTLIDQGIISKEDAHKDDILREYSLFHIATPYNRPSTEAMRSLGDETEELWFQVLNTSKWFVSPRGDRFISEYDTELKANEIDSITFTVDPRYPREHKVDLQLAGVNGPVELWLDTKQRLMNADHNPMIVDSAFKLALTNMLLRRLYYITSGVLASSQRRKEYEYPGWESPNFTYRRANYHVLVNDRYTMTSPGVSTHADEIFAEYGIDIFHERDRRRRLGVIGPTDHLTFNRETTPDVMPAEHMPNVVVYEPELLEEHLRKHRGGMMK